MAKSNKIKQLHQNRNANIALGVASFVAAWLMFIRAVDTGSLQQYAILIVLVCYGLNRLFRAVIPKV